jgi:aldehyde:ferredoxin oxidoreductase
MEIADALLEEERWRQVLSSLVVCFFARGIYTPETVRQALSVAGFERSSDDIARLGRETLRRKYDFKLREGFDPAKLNIPHRVLETPSPLGVLDEGFLRRAISHLMDRL